METRIEEYDVSFIINQPHRPARLLVTYVCLSREHYKGNPKLKREEVIKQNSLFLLSDRHRLGPDVDIRLLKIKPVKRLAYGRKGIVKQWKSIR